MQICAYRRGRKIKIDVTQQKKSYQPTFTFNHYRPLAVVIISALTNRITIRISKRWTASCSINSISLQSGTTQCTHTDERTYILHTYTRTDRPQLPRAAEQLVQTHSSQNAKLPQIATARWWNDFNNSKSCHPMKMDYELGKLALRGWVCVTLVCRWVYSFTVLQKWNRFSGTSAAPRSGNRDIIKRGCGPRWRRMGINVGGFWAPESPEKSSWVFQRNYWKNFCRDSWRISWRSSWKIFGKNFWGYFKCSIWWNFWWNTKMDFWRNSRTISSENFRNSWKIFKTNPWEVLEENHRENPEAFLMNYLETSWWKFWRHSWWN